jgi:hypothetical protein
VTNEGAIWSEANRERTIPEQRIHGLDIIGVDGTLITQESLFNFGDDIWDVDFHTGSLDCSSDCSCAPGGAQIGTLIASYV